MCLENRYLEMFPLVYYLVVGNGICAPPIKETCICTLKKQTDENLEAEVPKIKKSSKTYQSVTKPSVKKYKNAKHCD